MRSENVAIKSTGINGLGILSLQSLMVDITIIYCILFPADKLNIKEIILSLTLFVCLPAIIGALRNTKSFFLLFYAIIFPIFLTLYGLATGNTTLYDLVKNNYVWIYLLLVPAIVRYNIDIKKPFIFATMLIALITVFIFMFDFFGILSIYSNPIVSFLSGINELRYGKGIYSTFGYVIFYKSCPLLFFTYGHALYNKKYFRLVIILLAFAVSGTRANLLVALFVTAVIPLLSTKKPTKKIIIIIILIGIAIFVLPTFLDYYLQMSALKSNSSDLVKMEAIKSIFRYMNEEPMRYFFGSGIGSYFYSTGRNAYVNIVEVSYFDYFRQVGIAGFSFLIYFLIKPIKYCYSHERWLLIVYLGYLAIAATNPLLMSSTAFMAYISIYSCSMSEKRLSLL